jgi:hypothetical protein
LVVPLLLPLLELELPELEDVPELLDDPLLLDEMPLPDAPLLLLPPDDSLPGVWHRSFAPQTWPGGQSASPAQLKYVKPPRLRSQAARPTSRQQGQRRVTT